MELPAPALQPRLSLELGGNGPLVVLDDADLDAAVGGEPSGPAGLLLPPHVLLGGSDLPTAREEVFGPVITVISAAGEADALAIANDTEYGLSSAVFTRDAERGVAFASRWRPA